MRACTFALLKGSDTVSSFYEVECFLQKFFSLQEEKDIGQPFF